MPKLTTLQTLFEIKTEIKKLIKSFIIMNEKVTLYDQNLSKHYMHSRHYRY